MSYKELVRQEDNFHYWKIYQCPISELLYIAVSNQVPSIWIFPYLGFVADEFHGFTPLDEVEIICNEDLDTFYAHFVHELTSCRAPTYISNEDVEIKPLPSKVAIAVDKHLTKE